MATRKNTLLIKGSNVPGKVPSPGDLELKELGLNFYDVILYASGTSANSILPIGWDRIARTGDTITGPLYGTSISANTISGMTFYCSNQLGIKTTPLSSIDINGTQGVKRTQISGNTTLSNNYFVSVITSATTITVTLPPASGIGNRVYVIKDKSGNASTNNITIIPDGSDTIDNISNFVISINYESIHLITDGINNWEVF